MSGEREKGISYSAALHTLMLALVIWGLPELFDRNPPEEPSAISVEVLPISAISNVKPSEKQAPEEKKEPPKEQAKPSPPVNTAEPPPPPPPPKEEKKDTEKKKPDAKKEDKKQPKPKKPKEEDLTAVLKAVEKTAQQEKAKDTKDKSDSGSKSVSNQYDPTLPLTISEKDAIRSQIAKCWVVPAGAKDAYNLVVLLRVEVESTGQVRSVELASASKSRYNSDTFFRAAADSAIRAVHKCSPLQNLPPEKYSTWRDMELTFDPKEMLY